MLARSAERPADSPRQPVRAGLEALVIPATRLVELAQIGQEQVHRGIDVRDVLRDALTKSVSVDSHDMISTLSIGQSSVTRSQNVGARQNRLFDSYCTGRAPATSR
ncbi:MAG TPA: hypothetical protein VIU61_21310 [Kofleriaceae bacterium]